MQSDKKPVVHGKIAVFHVKFIHMPLDHLKVPDLVLGDLEPVVIVGLWQRAEAIRRIQRDIYGAVFDMRDRVKEGFLLVRLLFAADFSHRYYFAKCRVAWTF